MNQSVAGNVNINRPIRCEPTKVLHNGDPMERKSSMHQRRRKSTVSRHRHASRKWKRLFKIPHDEELVGNFNCTRHDNSVVPKHGILYIFQRHIAFYSNLFGKETKWITSASDVKSLHKTKTFIGQRIKINNSDGEAIFGGFKKCGQVFSKLSDVVNEPSLDLGPSPPVVANPRPPGPTSGTSSASTPASQSSLGSSALEVPSSGLGGVSPMVHTSRQPGSRSESPSMDHTSSDRDMDREEFDEKLDLGTAMSESRTSMNSNTLPDYIDTRFTQDQMRVPKDIEDLRPFVKAMEIDLPITVVEWFAMCFADDAEFSLDLFQNQVIGDTNIEYGRWLEDRQIDGYPLSFRREVKFHIKIKDPPPFCAKDTDVFETQRFRFFGPHCCVVDRSSQTPKVYTGDTFKIIQKWEVVDISDSACRLTVYQTMKWLKSNWFKATIEGRSTKENQEWLSNWAGWFTSVLDTARPAQLSEDPSVTGILDEPAPPGGGSPRPGKPPFRRVSQSTIDYFHQSEPKWWSVKTIKKPAQLANQIWLWIQWLFRMTAQQIDTKFNMSQLTALVIVLLGFQCFLLLICVFTLRSTVGPGISNLVTALNTLNEHFEKQAQNSCPVPVPVESPMPP